MRKIDKPKLLAENVFKTCVSKVRNKDLKYKLNNCISEVITTSDIFERKMPLSLVHQIKKANKVGLVSSKEMEKVYTARMAKIGAPGRSIYEKLLISSPLGICPLCNQRMVTTLDHYLPKADFPALVVTPSNLIPACKDCNIEKLSIYPTKSEEETLHPYFDDVENDQWLYVSLIVSNPISLKFYANPPTHLSSILKDRIKHHFNVFKLSRLYSTHGVVELFNMNYSLNEIFRVSGSSGIKAHLIEQEKSCKSFNTNSWQSALYHELANNSWFHNGGFNHIF